MVGPAPDGATVKQGERTQILRHPIRFLERTTGIERLVQAEGQCWNCT